MSFLEFDREKRQTHLEEIKLFNCILLNVMPSSSFCLYAYNSANK